MQIAFAKYLNERKDSVQLLGIAFNPDLASSFFTKFNELMQIPFLLLKLRKKIGRRAKVTAGVAG